MDLHAQITVRANKHLLTKHNQEFINTVAKYNFYPRLLQQIYSFFTCSWLGIMVIVMYPSNILWASYGNIITK